MFPGCSSFKNLLFTQPIVDVASGKVVKILGVHFDVTTGVCGGQTVDHKFMDTIEARLKVHCHTRTH
jgi:hypothetical protein